MTETQTLTLTDFLLARIAEDEATARAAATVPGAETWHWVDAETDEPITGPQYADVIAGSLRSVEDACPSESFGSLPAFLTSPGASPEILWDAAEHIARHDPARVLADCEAKRRIVQSVAAGEPYQRGADNYAVTRMVTRLLALPYADHPDYRDDWRP